MQSNSEARVSEGMKSLGQEHRSEGEDEEEDAICKRTRARYSLANFTLDQLETFLQETDDEDDLPNVDDGAEYRKFLAAVLQGGDGNGGVVGASGDGGGGEEDDDEENDADFEVEIEEALMESDADENNKEKGRREGSDRGRGELRRPETRQKRRQKDSSAQSERKLLGQAKIPLRPLLPSLLNGNEWPRLPLESVLHCPPTTPQFGQLGFTASQIGELHCLIHEHVQLLVQVYTLCVFESSRHHIASDSQKMLLEMVHKRDEALGLRKNPYPDFCFRPPFVHPSVVEEHPRLRSLSAYNGQKDCSDVNTFDCNMIVSCRDGPPTADLGDQNFPNAEDSIWAPQIQGPVMSVLDVAPLSLVGRYMADVSTGRCCEWNLALICFLLCGL